VRQERRTELAATGRTWRADAASPCACASACSAASARARSCAAKASSASCASAAARASASRALRAQALALHWAACKGAERVRAAGCKRPASSQAAHLQAATDRTGKQRHAACKPCTSAHAARQPPPHPAAASQPPARRPPRTRVARRQRAHHGRPRRPSMRAPSDGLRLLRQSCTQSAQ